MAVPPRPRLVPHYCSYPRTTPVPSLGLWCLPSGPGAVGLCSPAAAAQARGSGRHRQARSAGAGRRVHSRGSPPPAPPPRLPPPGSRAAAHPPAAHIAAHMKRTRSVHAAHAQRTCSAHAVHVHVHVHVCSAHEHGMQCTRSSRAACRASERSAASPSGSPSATATCPPPAATQRAEPPSLIRIGSSGAMAEPPHLRGVERRGIGNLNRASGSHRSLSPRQALPGPAARAVCAAQPAAWGVSPGRRQGGVLWALPRRRYPTCRPTARRAQCRCGRRWRRRSRRPRRTSCPPGGEHAVAT